MSFFNIAYFNAGSFLTALNEIPTPTTYSNIKVYGGCTIDDLWGVNKIMNTTEINSLDLNIQPDWTVDTFILAQFENNVQGGNIINLPNPIDNWLVLRKASTESKFTKIAEIGASVDNYVDKLAMSKKSYVYQLIPMAGDLLGTPIQSDPVLTDFTKVILMDDTTSDLYAFCLELSMSDISTEEDVVVNDTKGKYQTTLKGLKDVHVGTIGMILASNAVTDNEIQQDSDFLDGFEAFIKNGKPKLIKFAKGFTYRVNTSEFSKISKDGVDSAGNIIYRVSFTYRECGEV